MDTHTKREVLDAALLSINPGEAIRKLADSGDLIAIVPEILDLKMEVPDGHRHKDNYMHTLKVVDNAAAFDADQPDLTLRMAALLHDIGKPATRKFEGNKPTFYGHDSVGAKLARKRLEALGYSEEFIADVTHLVALHLRAFGYYPGKWEDSGIRRYITDAGSLLVSLNRLIRSDATTGRVEKAQRLKAAMDDLEARIEQVKERDRKAALRPALDGIEVMELTGLTQGPDLGKIMKHLNLLVRDGVILSKEEAVKEVFKVFSAMDRKVANEQ